MLPERLVLVMNRATETFCVVLLVDDASLVPRLCDLLQGYCGQTLREIGDIPLRN